MDSSKFDGQSFSKSDSTFVAPTSAWVTPIWTILVAACVSQLLWVLKQRLFSAKSLRLPPGPPKWPIFGSLFALSHESRPHRAFINLSKKYGRIMHLKLGSADAIVISDVKVLEEVFKSRDREFSSRPSSSLMKSAAKYIAFGFNDVALQPAGHKHAMLKKICKSELLASDKINEFAEVRRQEVAKMIQKIVASAREGEHLTIGDHFQDLVNNIMCLMLFGKTYAEVFQTYDFGSVVFDLTELMNIMNIGDLIPVLEWLDPQRLGPRFQTISIRLEKMFAEIIGERRELQANDERAKDFVDVLLNYESADGKKLEEASIKGLLLDMITGGTDTTSNTLQFLVAELVSNPSVLARLRSEVDSVVGSNRPVMESDIPRMPFLDAILKETFRLHPILPTGLPHLNEEQTTLAGYDIPAKTVLFTNTWAIGRDPTIWEDPLTFNPDRFISGRHSKVNVRGQDFELLPFGSGRRMCPGMKLTIISTKTALASFVHSFDFSLPNGKHSVDFDEIPSAVLKLRETLTINVKTERDFQALLHIDV